MSGSDYTKTTNYGLYKPIPTADIDQWGDHLNFDMDTLDTVIKGIEGKAGVTSWNTRTGPVTLSNADVVTVLPSSASAPLMDGAASAGTGTTWSRADHVHPTDTSRYAASNPAGYQTMADVTTALAPYALTSSVPVGSASAPIMDGTAAAGAATAWSRGDHVHPTDTTRYAASNPSGYQTAAQVAAVSQGFNYTDNAGFSVNQRGYVSGTALAAGAFGHDRWKAGAGGCTYTFAAGAPATTITITAGTLQQVVEGASIAGGNYMLSWTGTAQGRVGAGAYAASPVAMTGIAAGANTTIEFNTGTLGRVKLEPGTVVTPWIAASAGYDLSNCQRFFQTGRCYGSSYSTAGLSATLPYSLAVPMRSVPTIVITATAGAANVTGIVSVNLASPSALAFSGTVTATGQWFLDATFTASADL
jgi:hypothetical protein